MQSTMAAFVNQIRNELNVQHCPVEQHDEYIEDKCSTMQKYVLTKVESSKAQIQSLLEDVVVLKKAILYGVAPAIEQLRVLPNSEFQNQKASVGIETLKN